MSYLVRATELVGRPVVTLDRAEAVAEIKDVVFDAEQSDVLGFTLRGRGFLGTPNRGHLPLGAVRAIGRDAVMIETEAAIVEREAALEGASSDRRDVIGDEVLTDAGRRIGQVVDVILDTDGDRTDVVGYEVETEDRQRALVPIPETFAVSAANLVVPAAVEGFLAHDMTGFGGSVERFREHLRTGRAAEARENVRLQPAADRYTDPNATADEAIRQRPDDRPDGRRDERPDERGKPGGPVPGTGGRT
jgi:uncharacterized protein YrrD